MTLPVDFNPLSTATLVLKQTNKQNMKEVATVVDMEATHVPNSIQYTYQG